MNILFFLTPKSEVAYVFNTDTIGQAAAKLLECHFTTVPILNRQSGRYEGTLAADDLLRDLSGHAHLKLSQIGDRPLHKLVRRRDYTPVKADADIEDLLASAATQNFVPVVDDTGAFIGIITRREVIHYLTDKLGEKSEQTP